MKLSHVRLCSQQLAARRKICPVSVIVIRIAPFCPHCVTEAFVQTRILAAAALITVGISACSQPADEPRSQSSVRQKQELALTASPANGAVASPIEVARVGTADQSAPQKTRASRKNATKRAVEHSVELPNVDTRIQTSPATIAMAPAVNDIPLMELPSSGPSAGQDEGTATGTEARGREPGIGFPGVIIRGGNGSDGRDPCDLHDRGGRRSVPPVLVNPRIPGMGLPRAGDGGGRAPMGPSRGGGGGIRF